MMVEGECVGKGLCLCLCLCIYISPWLGELVVIDGRVFVPGCIVD